MQQVAVVCVLLYLAAYHLIKYPLGKRSNIPQCGARNIGLLSETLPIYVFPIYSKIRFPMSYIISTLLSTF